MALGASTMIRVDDEGPPTTNPAPLMRRGQSLREQIMLEKYNPLGQIYLSQSRHGQLATLIAIDFRRELRERLPSNGQHGASIDQREDDDKPNCSRMVDKVVEMVKRGRTLMGSHSASLTRHQVDASKSWFATNLASNSKCSGASNNAFLRLVWRMSCGRDTFRRRQCLMEDIEDDGLNGPCSHYTASASPSLDVLPSSASSSRPESPVEHIGINDAIRRATLQSFNADAGGERSTSTSTNPNVEEGSYSSLAPNPNCDAKGSTSQAEHSSKEEGLMIPRSSNGEGQSGLGLHCTRMNAPLSFNEAEERNSIGTDVVSPKPRNRNEDERSRITLNAKGECRPALHSTRVPIISSGEGVPDHSTKSPLNLLDIEARSANESEEVSTRSQDPRVGEGQQPTLQSRRMGRLPLGILLDESRGSWGSSASWFPSSPSSSMVWADGPWEEPSSALDPLCCVCMVGLKGAAFTSCGHTFCRKCTREVWKGRGTCPLCNTLITGILDIY